MKLKVKSNQVRTTVFFLVVLAASVRGFSQENINIGLVPQKEFETVISLQPVFGAGKEVSLPAIIVWDSENKRINVEIRSNRSNEERFVYAFPEKMFYKKVMKSKKDTWFDKSMDSKDKAVERSIDIPALKNVAYENKKDGIRTLELKDAEAKIMFSLRVTSSKNGDTCKIPMKLYVASKQKQKAKSERVRKIEYLAKFTLYIALWDVCENPEVEKQMSTLNADISTMSEQKTSILSEMQNLSCNGIRTKEPKATSAEKEKKLAEQFMVCEQLSEAINKYNEVLNELNDAITAYNSKLEEVKRRCSAPVSPCPAVNQANEKLTELLLDIKNSKKSKASLQQEFEKIKKMVEDPAAQKCKEYKVFKDLCSRIDTRLK